MNQIDKIKNKHFQDPLQCKCLCKKKEFSGNTTKQWKCWWYDEHGVRRFKSFAIGKYGYTGAERMCDSYLQEKSLKEQP